MKLSRLDLLLKVREVGGINSPNLVPQLVEYVVVSLGLTVYEIVDSDMVILKKKLQKLQGKSCKSVTGNVTGC